MSVRPTSKQAYEELKQDGILSFQENLVYRFIKRNPKKTRRQIAKTLDLDVSTVSARVNSLLNKRYVIDTKKGKCPLSGKNVGLLEIIG